MVQIKRMRHLPIGLNNEVESFGFGFGRNWTKSVSVGLCWHPTARCSLRANGPASDRSLSVIWCRTV